MIDESPWPDWSISDALLEAPRMLNSTSSEYIYIDFEVNHIFSELYSASQINRGPPGFSPSSRLHFDMLVGRDDRIDPSDYLNFSRHQV
jgi:hypothetical protein